MRTLAILFMLLFTSFAHAGSTKTNVTASNTAIEGGYTSSATTTYQSASSSNRTTSNTTTSKYSSDTPTQSATTYTSRKQDSCRPGGYQ